MHSKMIFTTFLILQVLFLVVLPLAKAAEHEVDPNGYILFCPCMGRFGNQIDHYLGVLAFSKGINRTLVLPPFVEYRQGQAKSHQVSFDTYFDVSKLSEFHRVVLMEDFMNDLAPLIWPAGEKRVSLCYAFRKGQKVASCNAKEGNPFGPFWDTFNVDFIGSEAYGPLHYDVNNSPALAEEWSERFPASSWPVLAFTGAPAAFPVQRENVGLQRYLVWNERMRRKGEEFVRERIPGPFVGIHLRNGVDWKRACEHVSSSPTLFSSAQCVGYRNEHGDLTQEMCQPSEEVIVKHLRRSLDLVKAKAVFVASDHDHMTAVLAKHFGKSVVFVRSEEEDPHLDLVVLGMADHFVGNCVSSFSAFVKRERDAKKRETEEDEDETSSSFWGFVPRRVKTEL